MGTSLFGNSRSPSLHATVEIDASVSGSDTPLFSKSSADPKETRILGMAAILAAILATQPGDEGA
jgi:hypothetical protein